MRALLHELWVDADEHETFCLAGPGGDGARALLAQPAELVWTVEANNEPRIMPGPGLPAQPPGAVALGDGICAATQTEATRVLLQPRLAVRLAVHLRKVRRVNAPALVVVLQRHGRVTAWRVNRFRGQALSRSDPERPTRCLIDWRERFDP
jgi:hypothetical protein